MTAAANKIIGRIFGTRKCGLSPAAAATRGFDPQNLQCVQHIASVLLTEYPRVPAPLAPSLNTVWHGDIWHQLV